MSEELILIVRQERLRRSHRGSREEEFRIAFGQIRNKPREDIVMNGGGNRTEYWFPTNKSIPAMVYRRFEGDKSHLRAGLGRRELLLGNFAIGFGKAQSMFWSFAKLVSSAR